MPQLPAKTQWSRRLLVCGKIGLLVVFERVIRYIASISRIDLAHNTSAVTRHYDTQDRCIVKLLSNKLVGVEMQDTSARCTKTDPAQHFSSEILTIVIFAYPRPR